MQRDDRERRNGHHGGIVWLTGLSGAGKSTLSQCVEHELFKMEFNCVVIDGDQLRAGLNQDLGFSEDERKENLRRAAEVASMFLNAGFIVLLAMIAPTRSVRDAIRKRFDSADFAEVYVKCSLETCERRDPKGLYLKARRGELRHFTGIDARYEPPIDPELIVDTEYRSIEACSQELAAFISHKYKYQLESEEA
ncbi:adenylyl-sulfate kinase [Paenibacillus glycanilyticus]|uniref:adenylyl-sulfate kinase n=1 Tax=Paenibacillus glycanilyticus TaxID=126569 RepID=UPI0020420FCC|nr:adenylyl-sulfate kinase [Paenibacillus glycanilyticus]MCM3628381.1 adenylyl-sulfate kinase [Paenibacillus glycanilyticus]